MSEESLSQWRERFPIVSRKKGYLVSHSLGAMPSAARERMAEYLDLWEEKGVVAWGDWLPRVRETADQLGRILNAPAGTVAMHQNVSTLIAIVASCFDWGGKRNEVVLTDLNFPSVVYNWKATERLGAQVRVVESPDGMWLEPQRIIDAIDDETAIVSLDYVQFRSSGKLDIAPIVEAAHAKGARVLIDCYQATGAVPVDVRALGVDFAVGGSVKWLCAGAGACYLYTREDLIQTLRPRMTGWFSDKRPFDFRFGEVDYEDDARRFMGGTPSVPAIYGARAGYETILEIGVPAIREHALRLTTRMMERADALGLTVNTPREPERRGNTVCLDFPCSEDASRRLTAAGYVVDWRPGCGIRMSPHFYNTQEECDGALSLIAELRESGELRETLAGDRTH